MGLKRVRLETSKWDSKRLNIEDGCSLRTKKIFQNSTGGRTMRSRQVHMNEHRAIEEPSASNEQGAGLTGPWIPISAFAGYGTGTGPRTSWS